MRLLLKWLRPEVVPSPRRKKIPFGTSVPLYLYRRCIVKLTKWYFKYAFSDCMSHVGTPPVRPLKNIAITHLRLKLNVSSSGCINIIGLEPAVEKRTIIRAQCHMIDKEYSAEMPTFLID